MRVTVISFELGSFPFVRGRLYFGLLVASAVVKEEPEWLLGVGDSFALGLGFIMFKLFVINRTVKVEFAVE